MFSAMDDLVKARGWPRGSACASLDGGRSHDPWLCSHELFVLSILYL